MLTGTALGLYPESLSDILPSFTMTFDELSIMLNIGDQVKVKVLYKTNDNAYRVVNEFGEVGILIVKGDLNVRKEFISVWVKSVNKSKKYVYVNSYFGKFDISKGIAMKYVEAIDRMFHEKMSLTSDNISDLKGMCNRCIKTDQWDWYTTWDFMGRPEKEVLHSFVSESIDLRNLVRCQDYTSVDSFREKYLYLLTRIRYRLSHVIDLTPEDIDLSPSGFPQESWCQLLFSSREYIKITMNFYQNSHVYLSMYLFSTIENEYLARLVKPFQHDLFNEIPMGDLVDSKSKYYLTEQVLTGQRPFTLGSIKFIHAFVENSKHFDKSKVIIK